MTTHALWLDPLNVQNVKDAHWKLANHLALETRQSPRLVRKPEVELGRCHYEPDTKIAAYFGRKCWHSGHYWLSTNLLAPYPFKKTLRSKY